MSQVVGAEELVRGIGWVITAIDQEIDGSGEVGRGDEMGTLPFG
jgi:hypothetical protein